MSTEKKADFSGVTATVDSTEQKAADFSGAVSYTHLDVYKRQMHCSLS